MDSSSRLKDADLTIRIAAAKRLDIEKLADHHARSMAWIVDKCLDAHLPRMLFEAGLKPRAEYPANLLAKYPPPRPRTAKS